MKKIVVYITLLICCSQLVAHAQQVKNGVLDLRNTDLQDQIELDGQWYFSWKALNDPTVFTSENSQLVDFPTIWNKLKVAGYQPEGYGTYQLMVLPGRNRKLAIYTPAVYNAFRFYINGELIASNGQVGTSVENSTPHWRQITTQIDRSLWTDTTIFTLQVSNFRHSNGGPVDNILLGPSEIMLAKRNYIFTLDAILTGSLIMGGLFFLGLFLFGRRQKNILYFSLFCITFSYYVFGSGNYLLHDLFPHIPWIISIKLEYLAIYLSVILLIKYTYKTYPEEGIPYVDKISIWVSSAYSIMVLLLPPYYFAKFHYYYLVFIVVVMVLGIYMYFSAFLNKRTGALLAFISTTMILGVLIIRAMHVFHFIELPIYIVPLGYMAFFFMQSVTTSQQVAISWQSAKEKAEAALKVKSDFLSTMSHEIRTPMNAVIGLTHHLLDSHPRADQKSTLNTLRFSSENLLRLINDILDYTKLEQEKLVFEEVAFDLQDLGQNLVSGFRTIGDEKGVSMIFNYGENLPTMFVGDPGRLTQVVSNLINNAVKFTEKGFVELIMSEEERTPETISIRFQVKDSGIGISIDDQKRIFEKFNQGNSSISRKYGGTGLGLAISKKILEMQGVKIQLDSKLGKGSTFWFVLTLKIAKGHRKKVAKSTGLINPLKEKHILLVDDNDINLMVAMRFLEKWHCEISVAKNGFEAIEVYKNGEFDLVLMDLQMPEMDGYEAARQLRKMGAKLPIIALTAEAMNNMETEIKKARMDDFILKPFHPDQLYQKLLKYLVDEPQLTSSQEQV